MQGPYITNVRVGTRRYSYRNGVFSRTNRRMALEEAEQVWDRKQLLELMGDSEVCPSYMMLMGSRPATVPEVEQVREIKIVGDRVSVPVLTRWSGDVCSGTSVCVIRVI